MKILFAGYAPVHFRCFKPLYERLRTRTDVKITLSGGLRSKVENGYEYDTAALYEAFDTEEGAVRTVSEIRDLDFDVQFSAHTKLIEPRRVDRRIQIFHGISFRNKAVRPENMGCDHYFVAGPYMLSRFQTAGLMDQDDPRVVKTGFMKTDPLLDGSLDRAALVREFGFNGDRPILVYAPTGAKKNSLETMGEDVIQALIGTGRYDLLVKPHDHPKNKDTDWYTYLRRYEDDHCRIIPPPADVIPALYIADLLLSDASSVANEYTLVDRPIVFLDTPKLLQAARNAANSMLDLDTFGRRGGLVAPNPAAAVAAVDSSLAQPLRHSQERRQMAQNFFYHPGAATRTALRWLEEHILPAQPARLEPPGHSAGLDAASV